MGGEPPEIFVERLTTLYENKLMGDTLQNLVKSAEKGSPKVWWDGMEHFMKSYPNMYRVWFTKHASGCCDTSTYMSYWVTGWSALYFPCNNIVERASHATRYREL